MELSGLQEALKKEIQCHQKLVVQMKQDPQNAELKKQLHECQAKITSLSEKQKKVVEQLRKDLLIKQQSGSTQKSATSTPVLAAKPISLVKSTNQAAPHAVVTQKAAVAMVTSLSNGQKPVLTSSDLPTANPINLQTTASKLLQENVARIPPKASQPQALSVASSPIKVPQLSSVHRLTGRNPATLTQVRPKPNSAAVSPVQGGGGGPQPSLVPLHKAHALLAVRGAGGVQHVRIVNGQQYKPRSPPPTQHASLAASTAAAAPSASVTAAAAPPSSAAAPPPPSSSAAASSGSAAAASSSSSSSPVGGVTVVTSGTQPSKDGTARQTSQTVYRANLSTRILSPRPQVEPNPQKVAFLGSLGLVTHEQMEEIQSRRQERKRRTTANPVYSGAMYEPERKRSAVTYLNNPVQTGTRKRGRPPKYASVLAGLVGPPLQALPSPSQPVAPLEQDKVEGVAPPSSPSDGPAASPATVSDGDIHEDFCSVCKRSGQLLMCDTCSRVYHLECLEPPLKAIPKGMWICPKCQEQVLRKEDALPWPGTLAIVHSYIAHKAAKEEEKRKLQKRSNELRQERDQLEQKAKMLSTAILKCMEVRNSLLSKQKEVQVGMERYRKLVQLINGVPAKPSKPPAQALQVVASTSSSVVATTATPLLIITTLTPDLSAMGAAIPRATSVAVSTSTATGILAQIHPPMAPATQRPHQPHTKH